MILRRRAFARLGLASAATLLALGAAELATRALGLAPQVGAIEISLPNGAFVSSPDPVLGYTIRPGAADVNALGCRDREHSAQADPGVERVVVLGDSVAYGFCNGGPALPVDQLFSSVLDDALGPGIEVLNYGVSGYDTRQEVRRFEVEARDQDPVLVLVAATMNDRIDASMELESFQQRQGWREDQQRARTFSASLLFRSHLARLIWARTQAQPPLQVEVVEDRVVTGFRRLGELAAEDGFGVLVAFFPNQDPSMDPRDGTRRLILGAAQLRGFDTLDLTSEMQGRPELYTPCNAMHPNAAGHARAAELLAPAVQRLLARRAEGGG